MNGLAQQVYRRLPPGARSAAATLRGFYLRSWRYGRETEQLVSEALERERWDARRWQAWRDERLAYVLGRAATKVPYYRAQWEARRRRGDRSSWERVENWPVLKKESVRVEPRAFVADDCNVRHMFHDHTSGTTGTSLDLWLRRESVRAWYALFEARCRRWYGVTRHHRWAMLGGQLVVPGERRRPPFWVWNAGLHQLYMSSYHLSPRFIPAYLEALSEYRVEHLLGYTSSLYALAQEVRRSGGRAPRLRVIVTNAEPVFEYQRRMIEEAFQCPVRETYGMAETVAAASECEHGRLHLWPEAGWIEGVEDAPEAGHELVSTGLLNADMPLIRYQTGDQGTLMNGEGVGAGCSCGRTLPILQALEGRTDEVLYTADGRRVGRLDPVFKAALPIREAQVIQESLQSIRVRYVPAPGYTSAAGHSIIERLQERLGEVEVTLEAVEEVPRGRNGKFRAVICQLAPEQGQQADGGYRPAAGEPAS